MLHVALHVKFGLENAGEGWSGVSNSKGGVGGLFRDFNCIYLLTMLHMKY